MKSMLRTSSALPLAALAMVACAAPAFAQDKANEDNNAPGEIVVTAQKRSENVQDVPVAVSVLSGERLAEASRPSIESASQMVPSLNFLKSGTTLNQTIFLRGVGTATFSIAGEPSVSTVVDGVVYSRSGEAFSDMVDVAQMEVLRGPQGTLFGKNASAGVINITTQMPKMEFGGSLEASYFDRNEVRVKGSVNLPVGQDLAAIGATQDPRQIDDTDARKGAGGMGHGILLVTGTALLAFWLKAMGRPDQPWSVGLSSANLAAMVGLPRVSFLMLTSWALSLAKRRLRSAPTNASRVFCRCLIDLSISSMAASNWRFANS